MILPLLKFQGFFFLFFKQAGPSLVARAAAVPSAVVGPPRHQSGTSDPARGPQQSYTRGRVLAARASATAAAAEAAARASAHGDTALQAAPAVAGARLSRTSVPQNRGSSDGRRDEASSSDLLHALHLLSKPCPLYPEVKRE